MARTTIPAELVAINAIQGTLIADNAITAVHIATNAVSGTLVADNAITSTHIAQNNVTATQILQNTITVTQIADSAVETAKINNDAVTQAKIADDAVGPDQLAANAVVSASIANGTIVEADMADNAVTLAKMASLARGKIIVGDSAGDPSALAIGSNGTVLKSDGTDVSWGTVAGGVDGISTSADATAITIDSSENIGMPAVGPVNPVASSTPKLGISGVNAQEAQIVIHRHKANGLGPYFVLAKSRSDTNDKTIIQNGDTLGTISFQGADGSNFQQGAAIAAVVSDAPAAGDMPADLRFYTTLDGTNSLVEHTRILNNGAFKTKQGTSAYANVTSNYNEICSNADATANLLVRQGSTYYADCINLWHYASTGPNNVHSNFLNAFDEQATRAKILSNGGFANYQSNDSNLCDEREKKNITTASNTWNDVKAWNIKQFHYNEDDDSDSKRYGVIAQEIETTNPELITDWEKNKERAQELWQEGDKPLPEGVNVGDEKSPAQAQVMRKAVKEQQMYMMAIKALQEAMTEIDSLKARITTLEG